MSELIELRPEGLYCAAGDFYIDPWRPVARAVITHGHADHARTGSQHYYAARAGMGLLEWRLPGAHLSPLDYGESVRLGTCDVSLHPAGHVLGSAQVRVECAGEVWVASGDYKRAPDPTCALFEPQRCDVFITEATFAMPIYRWPTMAEVIAELDAFWAECQAQGETAVLLCYALGKAQRVLAELYARCPHRRDEVVLLHGAMETPVEIYRRAGIDMLKGESLIGSGVESTIGRLLIAPPSAAGTPFMQRVKNPKVAFASGWMQVRGVRRRASYDRGFVISDHADWPALIDSIKDSGASRVLATHGRTQALVRYLNEQGIRASALATELGGEDT